MNNDNSFDNSQNDYMSHHNQLAPHQSIGVSYNQATSDHNNSFQGNHSFSNNKIDSYNNYQDVIRDGQRGIKGMFQQQDNSLNQTVIDCYSDFSMQLYPNTKDLYEGTVSQINDIYNLSTNQLIKDKQRHNQEIQDQILNQANQKKQSQNKDDQEFKLSSPQNKQIIKQSLTMKNSQKIQVNSNQLQEQTIQDTNNLQDSCSTINNLNRSPNQQILYRESYKLSSYSASQSSHQIESNQQTQNHINGQQGQNKFTQNKNKGNYFNPTSNISDFGKNNQNNQKQVKNEEINVDITNDNSANNLNKHKSSVISNINQTILSNIQPDDAALLELQKKRQSRISIMNQTSKFSFKFFKKANLIKNFVKNMVQILPQRLYQNLESKHFQIIGDKSFQYNSIKQNINQQQVDRKDHKTLFTRQGSIFQRYKTMTNNLNSAINKMDTKIVENIPIIQPNGSLFVGWSIFLLLFLLVQLTIAPLLFVFQAEVENQIFQIITGPLAISVFFIQIILNLNTGYYNEGGIIKSRLKIFKKYFRFQFWLDIFTIAVIGMCTFYSGMEYLKMIYLFRVFQVFQLLHCIEEHFQLQQKYYTTYELTKLFCLIFFVAHYCGCLFYLLSRFDYQNNINQESWIKKYDIANNSWDVIYLDALYFSFITMATVGYGDLVPISINEKIYVILFSIVSCGIFGYAVNTIGSIFQELSQKQANYKLKKFEITQYMEGRSIQRTSQIKVLKYLEYMNSQEEERNYLQQGEIILNGISKHLREEIQQDFFGKILLNSDIFKNVFTNKLIDQLSLLMKEITLGPGDIIFNKGDNDKRLYYVFKGQVENILELNNKIIKFGNYEVGNFFGQKGFFADTPREFTAKSKGTTHIVYCKREDMMRLIQENPLDQVWLFIKFQITHILFEYKKEAFQMIKDEILFKENVCGHKCLSCNQVDHIEKNCKYFNLRVSKQQLYLKNNYSTDQQRKLTERNDKLKYNAQKNYHYTKKILKQFRVTCALEAVDQWDDLAILQDAKLTDQEFYMRMPRIKVNEVGIIVQDTNDSLCSDDEEMQFFIKDEEKGSQTLVQGVSDVNALQGQTTQKHVRILTRRNTHKVYLKQDEQNFEKAKVIRSSTKKDTCVYYSPTILHHRRLQIEFRRNHSQFHIFLALFMNKQIIRKFTINIDLKEKTHISMENVDKPKNNYLKLKLPKESSLPNIAFPLNKQDTIAGQNSSLTIKTHRTLKRHDSSSSVHSYHKRNTIEKLSHFGTTANTVNDEISDQELQSPVQNSNLSVLQRQNLEIKPEHKYHTQREIYQNPFDEYEQFDDIEEDFDLLKEYTIYYPQNNLTQVLRLIKKSWMNRFSKKRRTKHSIRNTQKSRQFTKSIKIDTKNTQKTIPQQDQYFENGSIN